jgi:hypothetical protein
MLSDFNLRKISIDYPLHQITGKPGKLPGFIP